MLKLLHFGAFIPLMNRIFMRQRFIGDVKSWRTFVLGSNPIIKIEIWSGLRDWDIIFYIKILVKILIILRHWDHEGLTRNSSSLFCKFGKLDKNCIKFFYCFYFREICKISERIYLKKNSKWLQRTHNKNPKIYFLDCIAC